jgi:hypothetical protein
MTPASESSAQEVFLARWYETFLDVVKAAKRREMGVAVHPSNQSPIRDMMERVYEDELWNLGDLPPLLVHSDVEPGTYQLVDVDTLNLISFRAAMGKEKGLGRFTTIYTPDATLRRRP